MWRQELRTASQCAELAPSLFNLPMPSERLRSGTERT